MSSTNSVKTPQPQAKPAVLAAVKAAEDLKVDTSAKSSVDSIARSTSMSSSSSSTAVSEKSQYFSESYSETKSSYKSVRTMTMSFAQSTRKHHVSAEGILSAECLLADGEHWKVSTFDLHKYLGNINGELKWGYKDFHRTSEGFRIEGTKLFAKCKLSDGHAIKECWFDLAARLRSDNGVIVVIEYNESLSTMLSEVPWMKFKVVAEPDFSIIAAHPVMQATMNKIAHSTVEHVTAQMSSIMALAIAGAIEVVTKSAYEHISQSMEVMVQGVSAHAQVHSSVNTGSKLHVFGEDIVLSRDVKEMEIKEVSLVNGKH
ncbi:hypothetical protein BDP27DRAFT_1365826 [Rhodocollybia butyracea]|uniref:Cyanovirin-N domain-containing protein n=1 Tax=Rhodocollybia butyracea TaxID=206335 RepID=A0A9P5U5X2_9AGAR|nr:hypothetical protein BDP27DRAFT_1365826 [Rhodocollybia butyracea]